MEDFPEIRFTIAQFWDCFIFHFSPLDRTEHYFEMVSVHKGKVKMKAIFKFDVLPYVQEVLSVFIYFEYTMNGHTIMEIRYDSI